MRITDERTGKRCDYKALALEVRQRMRRERVSWRKAAEAVAAQVNEEQSESIVRSLNRYRRNATPGPSPASPELGPLPGLAMLYRNIEEKLRLIDQTIEKAYPQSDDFYATLAETLRKLRVLLEGLRDLTVSQEKPALQMLASLFADLGEQDSMLQPAIVYEGELELVKMLIERARHLQNEVNNFRLNPTWEEF